MGTMAKLSSFMAAVTAETVSTPKELMSRCISIMPRPTLHCCTEVGMPSRREVRKSFRSKTNSPGPNRASSTRRNT